MAGLWKELLKEIKAGGFHVVLGPLGPPWRMLRVGVGLGGGTPLMLVIVFLSNYLQPMHF